MTKVSEMVRSTFDARERGHQPVLLAGALRTGQARYG